MQDSCSNLKNEFQTKISSGNSLLKQVSCHFNTNVNGTEKLKKKIKQEIIFLTKVMNSGLMKKEHLHCTNLHHFEAMVSCALQEKECCSILETLTVQLDNGSSKRICVDIVSQNGHKWTKVIARNAAALSRISVGGGDFGQKTILDQAAEYVNCAQQHPHHFRPPLVLTSKHLPESSDNPRYIASRGYTDVFEKVVFHFASGIGNWLALELERLGVIVTGERLEDEFIQCDDGSSESSEETTSHKLDNLPTIEPDTVKSEVSKLNLDITTMIAFVSALTNGGSNYEFDDPLLSQQASWERLRPVKPQLDKLFQGKQLYCCTTAAQDFETIVDTLGGTGEKERAAELMTHVTVVPDIPFNCLKVGGKIKSRSVVIFGTGHMMRALTVTANEGFVRAAKNQGMKFAVYIHESRALTEAKQCQVSLSS